LHRDHDHSTIGLFTIAIQPNLSGVSIERTQRKKRNEMTSLSDKPITAASDDGVCRWHAAKLSDTRHKI